MRQISTWITCMVEQLRSISMYRCIFILSVHRIFERVSQNNHYFSHRVDTEGVCFVVLLQPMNFFVKYYLYIWRLLCCAISPYYSIGVRVPA